jgi:hypothetical protein
VQCPKQAFRASQHPEYVNVWPILTHPLHSSKNIRGALHISQFLVCNMVNCSITLSFFTVCWPCISTYACNETNLMHYLSSVHSVTIPLKINSASSRFHYTHISRCTVNMLRYSDNKLKINSASSWFHYTYSLSFLDLNNIQTLGGETLISYIRPSKLDQIHNWYSDCYCIFWTNFLKLWT